ncbi:MAG TPA: sigma-70 family RNA polymerase sigma factor [Gemmatimonadota bacterium]|nr:sigma-70 family RNA polymerase sigma factor [Gemmatimonadota bacterium]
MSDLEDRYLQLVEENRGRMRRLCRVYARDAEAARDLYQEMLLQVWRSLPSFEGRSEPGTWLYRVALNTALQRRRRRDRRSEATLDPDDPLRDRGFVGPEERFEDHRRIERLHSAIDRLGEGERALALLYLEEKSYAEMSEILGISQNHVGVKLHRIKKKLSKMVKEDDQ